MEAAGFDSDSALAASWCTFGIRNIEALIDDPTLAGVFPTGILASVGNRKLFGGRVKYSAISFKSCKEFGPADTSDPRGMGKYCIEFAGPGGILLGRLQWNWRVKRFGDSRAQVMAVAEERDRILEIVSGILGG
jgi:hypothetical protein